MFGVEFGNFYFISVSGDVEGGGFWFVEKYFRKDEIGWGGVFIFFFFVKFIFIGNFYKKKKISKIGSIFFRSIFYVFN